MAEAPIKVDTGAGGTKIVHADFPGNSRKAQAERPKAQKVASGKVTTRKRGLGKALAESFTGEERKNVGEYIIFDVLVPAAKMALVEGLGMFLGVDIRSSRSPLSRRDSSPRAPKVSYGGYFDDARGGRRSDTRRSYDLIDVKFESRSDAINVLNQLIDILDEYRMVSVSDYYNAAGIDATYVDDDYGWTNLHNAIITPVRGGEYVIDFPRVVSLK